MMSCNSSMSFLPSPTWNLVFGGINVAVSVTATLENLLVLFILFWYKDLHTLTNRIFVSLAVTDVMVGLTAAPLHAAELLIKDFSHNCLADQARRSISSVLIGASAFTIATISYDRYLHLTKLCNYNEHMTKRKINIFIAFSWMIPGILPILQILDKSKNIYVSVFSAFMGTVFIVLLICYVMILSVLRQRAAWRKRSAQLEIRQLRTMKTVITIITCYFIMGLPVTIPLILLVFRIDPKTNGAIYVSVLTLNMLNSSVNPVIYYCRNPNFKRNAMRLFYLSTSRNQINCSVAGCEVNHSVNHCILNKGTTSPETTAYKKQDGKKSDAKR